MTENTFTACNYSQRGWGDEQQAKKALGRLRTKRQRGADRHGSRRGLALENRTFRCPDCSMFHLASRSHKTHKLDARLLPA